MTNRIYYRIYFFRITSLHISFCNFHKMFYEISQIEKILLLISERNMMLYSNMDTRKIEITISEMVQSIRQTVPFLSRDSYEYYLNYLDDGVYTDDYENLILTILTSIYQESEERKRKQAWLKKVFEDRLRIQAEKEQMEILKREASLKKREKQRRQLNAFFEGKK